MRNGELRIKQLTWCMHELAETFKVLKNQHRHISCTSMRLPFPLSPVFHRLNVETPTYNRNSEKYSMGTIGSILDHSAHFQLIFWYFCKNNKKKIVGDIISLCTAFSLISWVIAYVSSLQTAAITRSSRESFECLCFVIFFLLIRKFVSILLNYWVAKRT